MKKIGCYLMKLHSAAQYENVAFMVKPYSAALYNILNSHAREDRKHAEMIYEDTVKTSEDEGLKAFNNVMMPLILVDDSKDDVEDIAKDSLNAFIWMEKEVYQQFIVHESFGFAEISQFRIEVLEEALKCVENGTIFGSHHMSQWWKCATCGAIYIEKEPHSASATECHICGAGQGSFVKHFGIGA